MSAELNESLMNHIAQDDGSDLKESYKDQFGKFTDLNDTAVKWAEFCLQRHSGKALRLGLKISRYLAEYEFEVNGK